MLSFISRQSTKKMSVFKLFPTRRKQKNTSLNNLTAQTCVKFFFSVMYILPKSIRWSVG